MGHECPDCSFVSDIGTLLFFLVPRETRERAGKKPEFVGKFTMTDWAGHSGFYIFKCSDCDTVCIDYPHGYCENGCLFLRCDKCQFRFVFYPSQYRDVYEREGVVAPLTTWETFKYFWRNRKKIKEIRKTAVLKS